MFPRKVVATRLLKGLQCSVGQRSWLRMIQRRLGKPHSCVNLKKVHPDKSSLLLRKCGQPGQSSTVKVTGAHQPSRLAQKLFGHFCVPLHCNTSTSSERHHLSQSCSGHAYEENYEFLDSIMIRQIWQQLNKILWTSQLQFFLDLLLKFMSHVRLSMGS